METHEVREAVGVFDDYDALYDTIKELGTSGFGRHQISVLGSDAAVRERLGDPVVTPEWVEDNPIAPRSPIIGVEELGVAQGVLVGAFIYLSASLAMYLSGGLMSPNAMGVLTIACITGMILGVVAAIALGRSYERFFKKRLASGGLVLWVETPNPVTERVAQTILYKHGAHDVHIHDMPVAA